MRALSNARACLKWGAAALVFFALRPSTARAADFEVQADTALQGYAVASPWGDAVLQRRRFMQTVGLGVYNLQGGYRPGEADYRVVMMMRLNADFGINAHLPAAQSGGETNYATASGNGVRFVPGLEEAPLDIMYGYIEGRNLAHGLLGFKLGRQYMTDVLGWWSFDGGLVRVTTPYYVQAEVYGGLEQRGGLPLSSPRYEQQGIWRGSHSGFGLGAGLPSVTDYPAYQYAEPAPAYGFALESNGPTWIHGRFSYRHVYNTGTSVVSMFPDPSGSGYRTISGTRTSQEKLGYAIDLSKPDLGGVKGGFTYDLYNQLIGSYYGGVEAYAGKRATLGADIDYYVPTFDADSIWNWFTHSPVTTISGRVAARFTKRFDASLSGGVRLWVTDGNPTTFGTGECKALDATGKVTPPVDCSKLPSNNVYYDPSYGYSATAQPWSRQDANRALTTTLDGMANLNARYRFGSGNVSFRGMMEAGGRGSREGGDLAGEKGLDGGRFTAGARVSLYGWHDPTRPDRDATSFGYVLAGGFKPAKVADFRLEWEHDMNHLVGQRFRVLALINLLVLK
jgi:hypothetical protein